jgi:hypothetical protein
MAIHELDLELPAPRRDEDHNVHGFDASALALHRIPVPRQVGA